MQIDLTGKKALVTGASRGLGRAIALSLARAGADVVITYEKSADKAHAVADEIKALGRYGEAVQADSASAQAIQDAVTHAALSLGGLDMLVLPGGLPGTKNLENCQELMEKLDEFYASENKYVAAVCAAPSIFGHRGYLKGRRATSFPDFECHLEGSVVTHGSAEVDGNVVTGRGMGCAIPFGLAIVELFQGKNAADALAEKIVYTR